MQNFPEETLATIKKHLEEERARINARIETLSGQDPFSDPDRANDNAASDTDASEESDHDRVAAIVSELRAELERIEAAQARIADGTYGTCSVCGTPIPPDRLAILPTATLCVTHEQEQQAKRS
jgi:RNA polymerase-binding transcription factor DksA